MKATVADWITLDVAAPDDRSGFLDKLPRTDVIWHVLEPLTAADISAAPNLKLIQKIGVGVNTIDLEAAKSAGVAVANMPGSNAPAVAEMALMLMLATLRRGHEMDAAIRQVEGWNLPADFFDHVGEIRGKTIGLIGYGSIAQLLAPMLQAMGANVIFHTQRKLPDAVARQVELNELLGLSDIVSLHVPLTNETQDLMDSTRFEQMKPGAILINTARGELVDEAALVEALISGKLAAAGLDVFGTEPVSANSALLGLDNVVLTPHAAWNTPETAERSYKIAVENCRRLKDDQTLLHRVC